MYDKSSTTDPVTDKLIKDLKSLDPAIKHKKVNQLPSSMMSSFSFENNPDYLMENAMKVPRDKEEVKFIQ